jgi:hypothetical protein
MTIPAIETRRHLFELVTAGLGVGTAISKESIDKLTFQERGFLSWQITNLLADYVKQIRDRQWTDEYANALISGAALLCGFIVANGWIEDWSARALLARQTGVI